MVKKVILTMVFAVWCGAADLSYDTFKWPAGVSFLSFLEEMKIPGKLYYDLDPEEQELATEIRAGQTCELLRDESGKIYQLLIPIGEELQLHMFRGRDDAFNIEFIPIEFSEEERRLGIHIEVSPGNDIVNATGSGALASAVGQIFKRVVDDRKYRKGDGLAIVYRQRSRLGRPHGTPVVISAMVEQGGKNFHQYEFEGKFYDESGKKTQQAFMFGLPVKGNYRISSKFTPKRFHPILKRYRAHMGTDYAAPKGTPIYAAGDGTVSFVGTKSGYGRTVEIKHAGGYKTLYAHTSAFAKGLKTGQSVKQGTLIAYVGSTGLSSGPHLHMGLYKNEVAMDFEKVVHVEKKQEVSADQIKFKKIMQAQNDNLQLALSGEFNPPKFETFENLIELN